jgi:ABC-type molybdate transport system permease subunit
MSNKSLVPTAQEWPSGFLVTATDFAWFATPMETQSRVKQLMAWLLIQPAFLMKHSLLRDIAQMPLVVKPFVIPMLAMDIIRGMSFFNAPINNEAFQFFLTT